MNAFNSGCSRFVNHSCDPNVVIVPVFTHSDYRFPKYAYFAMKNIPALTEITFDYGLTFWKAKLKRERFFCSCGTEKCRNKEVVALVSKEHRAESHWWLKRRQKKTKIKIEPKEEPAEQDPVGAA